MYLKYFRALFIIFVFSYCSSLNGQVGNLIWQEEFNDLDNWIVNYGNGNWGWGNGELQYYNDNNVSIQEIPGEPGNNAIVIRAQAESGPNITDQWGNPLNYTSGKVTSLSEVQVKYGMIETRIRVPNLDLGGWPAFWMLGTSNFGWPMKGELDLMEMGASKAFRDLHDEFNGGNGMNNSTVNEMTGANAIYFSEDAVNGNNPLGIVSLADDPNYNRPYFNHNEPLDNRFLIHRLYWDESSVRFTVEDNGIEHELYTGSFNLGAGTDALQDPFYFIINMALGGTYTDCYNLGDPSSGLPITIDLPADMYVDYIKVFEWNGQGEVSLGPPQEEVGRFGIFTDETPVDAAHLIDEDAFIFAWENTLSAGSIAPLEGDNVLSWQTNDIGWFGAGVLSEQPINLFGFGEGTVNFDIKIPANVSFKIGVTDTWGNQNYVDFPAFQTTYGLVRNGEWGQASIPVDDIRGPLIDLRMMAYTFVILEVEGANCEFALDDIYWDDGLSTNVNEIVGKNSFDLSVVPMPVVNQSQIRYSLDESSRVELHLYDISGRLIEVLDEGFKSAGEQIYNWDARLIEKGSYVIRLKSSVNVVSKSVLVQ